MRSVSDLTPERVLDIYEKHETLNFHKDRDLRDSAIAEHLKSTQVDENPMMSFDTYQRTIGATAHQNTFQQLLSEHRTVQQYEAEYQAPLQKSAKGFAKPFGEFSYEVERNINAGVWKRK